MRVERTFVSPSFPDFNTSPTHPRQTLSAVRAGPAVRCLPRGARPAAWPQGPGLTLPAAQLPWQAGDPRPGAAGLGVWTAGRGAPRQRLPSPQPGSVPLVASNHPVLSDPPPSSRDPCPVLLLGVTERTEVLGGAAGVPAPPQKTLCSRSQAGRRGRGAGAGLWVSPLCSEGRCARRPLGSTSQPPRGLTTL